MIKRFLLIILFIMQFQLLAMPKEIFVVSEEWKSYTNKDGTGLYFDIVKLVYEPIGIKVKIKIYPYNRSVQMVEKKQADFWLGSFKDEEDYAIYPIHYYDKDIITAMFKKDKFKTFEGIESLRDRKVGWIRGYNFDEDIDVPMNINERNNRKSLLKSLEKDRFDILLDDKSDIQEAIKETNFDASKYNFVKLLEFNLYPAFRNDNKGKELRKIWDERINILIKNGLLKDLYIKNNYLKDYPYKSK